MIPLNGPWEPGNYALNNNRIVSEAKGVLPGPESYIPWPGLTSFSLALASGACRGAYTARASDGTYKIYAGTATKLYIYVSATDAWTDATRLAGGDYSVPDNEQWQFAQFGDKLVAVQLNDDPQVIDIDSGTNFAALGGSPPKAKYVETVGDQLFLGSTASLPNGVVWSGRNDITYWTAGLRDSDQQEFPDGGFVHGLTGLETGLIFQEGLIRRFQPVDSRALFEFSTAENQRGLLAPSSLVTVGRIAYYLSEDGFYATDGSGNSQSLGEINGVNEWFQAEVNYDRIFSVIGAADPVHLRVYWLFPSVGNVSTTLDRVLCYDIAFDRWTHADINAEFIFAAATAGYSLDALDSLGYDLDTLPYSLDSKILTGGAPYLGAFASNKLQFFSGDNLAARIETSGRQLSGIGRRAFVQGCIPYTDAENATMKAGTIERPQDSYTYGNAMSINAQGMCPMRSSSRYHRFRIDVPSGESWTHIKGVDPIFEDDGDR